MSANPQTESQSTAPGHSVRAKRGMLCTSLQLQMLMHLTTSHSSRPFSALSSSTTRSMVADTWDNEWCAVVIAVASALASTEFQRNRFAEFLAWPAAPQAGQQVQDPRRDNFFRYPAAAPRVAVRVGSIHSVKGETHTATMVLDTYFRVITCRSSSPGFSGRTLGRERREF